MAKYDWNTFRNYVAFLAGEMASGTKQPHHDSELISWYHDAFLPWDHFLNNILLFYHDSPITRSHFMDPTDRAIKGFYCISKTMWWIIITNFLSFDWLIPLEYGDSNTIYYRLLSKTLMLGFVFQNVIKKNLQYKLDFWPSASQIFKMSPYLKTCLILTIWR